MQRNIIIPLLSLTLWACGPGQPSPDDEGSGTGSTTDESTTSTDTGDTTDGWSDTCPTQIDLPQATDDTTDTEGTGSDEIGDTGDCVTAPAACDCAAMASTVDEFHWCDQDHAFWCTDEDQCMIDYLACLAEGWETDDDCATIMFYCLTGEGCE